MGAIASAVSRLTAAVHLVDVLREPGMLAQARPDLPAAYAVYLFDTARLRFVVLLVHAL
jgi:hypothetical protein